MPASSSPNVMGASTQFPAVGLQALIASIILLGVSILTLFFSRRLPELQEGSTTRQTWARPSWLRVCVLLIFLDSYCFVFASGILIFGVGLQRNSTTCAAAIYLCVLFYTSSKVLIYAFLTEKAFIVWDTGRSRRRSPVYLVCVATIALYFAVILAVLFEHISEFRPGDTACVIGLKPTASLPLLCYDLCINILLTGLFLWPIIRSAHSSTRLRRVAMRTLVASGAALTTSTINIGVLTALKGRQLGWVCLASCGADVVFNAAAVFWVTARTSSSGSDSFSAHSSDGGNRRATIDSHNVLSFAVPPSPAHVHSFKRDRDDLPAPVSSPLGSNFFRMGDLPPSTARGFQIRVTTESQVCTSPPPMAIDSTVHAKHPST
ncbi:hypothetical protein FB45DRAFT_895508 [Roridomyces roridus]|uniref:Uncharacterized protein n=1 Tax=Roridomyces roridus TaxID=1738132 RepID=A0AAD7FU87_9AGAR|nr:hypothetical protein FB45DRAFT_895508 [Roridomyces roridus]